MHCPQTQKPPLTHSVVCRQGRARLPPLRPCWPWAAWTWRLRRLPSWGTLRAGASSQRLPCTSRTCSWPPGAQQCQCCTASPAHEVWQTPTLCAGHGWGCRTGGPVASMHALSGAKSWQGDQPWQLRGCRAGATARPGTPLRSMRCCPSAGRQTQRLSWPTWCSCWNRTWTQRRCAPDLQILHRRLHQWGALNSCP